MPDIWMHRNRHDPCPLGPIKRRTEGWVTMTLTRVVPGGLVYWWPGKHQHATYYQSDRWTWDLNLWPFYEMHAFNHCSSVRNQFCANWKRYAGKICTLNLLVPTFRFLLYTPSSMNGELVTLIYLIIRAVDRYRSKFDRLQTNSVFMK